MELSVKTFELGDLQGKACLSIGENQLLLENRATLRVENSESIQVALSHEDKVIGESTTLTLKSNEATENNLTFEHEGQTYKVVLGTKPISRASHAPAPLGDVTNSIKTSADSIKAKLEAMKLKLESEREARVSLETELNALKSKIENVTSSWTSQVANLKKKLAEGEEVIKGHSNADESVKENHESSFAAKTVTETEVEKPSMSATA